MKSKTHTLGSILPLALSVWLFWSVMIEAETDRSDAMLGQIRLASMEEITKGFSPAAIEEELSL